MLHLCMCMYICVCVCVCVCARAFHIHQPGELKAFYVRIKQSLDTDNNWNPSIQDCNLSLGNITTKQNERDESTK